MNKRTYVGLDVHARSVKGCAIDHETGEILRQSLAANETGIAEWVSGLPGPVLGVYEAGPTGFGLARLLVGAGIECLVAAPSKLQRPPGDRVKTDARDAEHLARLALLGQITPVWVPGNADEAARDLVRAREDVRADLMRARHRISKLLLYQSVERVDRPCAVGVHGAAGGGQDPHRLADPVIEPGAAQLFHGQRQRCGRDLVGVQGVGFPHAAAFSWRGPDGRRPPTPTMDKSTARNSNVSDCMSHIFGAGRLWSTSFEEHQLARWRSQQKRAQSPASASNCYRLFRHLRCAHGVSFSAHRGRKARVLDHPADTAIPVDVGCCRVLGVPLAVKAVLLPRHWPGVRYPGPRRDGCNA